MAKSKSQATTPAATALTLATLVGFGGNGTYANQADVQPLVDAGHAEVGPINEQGQVAVRATEAGFAAHQAAQPAGTEGGPVGGAGDAAPSPAKRSFVIEDNVPLTNSVNRGGRRGSSYPFDQLEVNQSFFVADADTESGSATRSMASTVTAQNNRYSEVVPGEVRTNRKGREVAVTKPTRKFVMRGVEENGVKGARIWRVSL